MPGLGFISSSTWAPSVMPSWWRCFPVMSTGLYFGLTSITFPFYNIPICSMLLLTAAVRSEAKKSKIYRQSRESYPLVGGNKNPMLQKVLNKWTHQLDIQNSYRSARISFMNFRLQQPQSNAKLIQTLPVPLIFKRSNWQSREFSKWPNGWTNHLLWTFEF